MVRYNQEGDLLFSSSKDNVPNVWFSNNGELLGSYNGHNGAIWCLDVSCNFLFDLLLFSLLNTIDWTISKLFFFFSLFS